MMHRGGSMGEWMDEIITRFSEQAALVWAEQETLEDDAMFRRLWNLAGETGLCRVGIPEAHGGVGGGGPEISEMLRRLTLKTGNLGLPLALMISQLVAHFMVGALGSEDQKAAWLPPMAEGRFPSAFAVSEPKVGAHPGKLSTHAEKIDGQWCLAGKKSYISNGPMAGLVVTIAVVGEEKGRKQFSAFLLGGDTPGVDRSDAMALPFFRPALHGNIRLDGVSLGAGTVLGHPGEAYAELVLPFRRYEDAMMMGCVVGAFRFVLDRLGDAVANPDDAVCETAGTLAAHVTALERVARVSADLTADPSPEAVEESTALLLHFRQVAGCCRTLVASLEESGFPLDDPSRAVMEDLAASSGIAANIARAKQVKLGRACLAAGKGL
ncbi:Acyl-CoA dehydrogenase [Desulfoluna spongiiphila]|uniref:Acyl-CoA dehydrogenase n=2 Tax=Desulfoluna spongiiphila TaxID=419481 RepID=A0A1G5AN17_9BACT|nr:Acyl-CoA dehydrogenase [Desulfoluna spongiiphila]